MRRELFEMCLGSSETARKTPFPKLTLFVMMKRTPTVASLMSSPSKSSFGEWRSLRFEAFEEGTAFSSKENNSPTILFFTKYFLLKRKSFKRTICFLKTLHFDICLPEKQCILFSCNKQNKCMFFLHSKDACHRCSPMAPSGVRGLRKELYETKICTKNML